MVRHPKGKRSEEQWTRWVKAHRLLPAWKALCYPARDAYFHLQVRCFAETAARKGNVRNNNGEVYRSLRDLAEDMGCSIKTAGAALADLQAKGWIICTNPWQRGLDGNGKTATFRLTMLPSERQPASQEPKAWTPGHDYPVAVYASYLPKPRGDRARNLTKQTPPPSSDTPVCPTRARLRAVN
jgi:DNA-binding transcriptional MocR family regulator